MSPMFGIGHWELLLIGLCCAVPLVAGTLVALVLVMSNQPPRQ